MSAMELQNAFASDTIELLNRWCDFCKRPVTCFVLQLTISSHFMTGRGDPTPTIAFCTAGTLPRPPRWRSWVRAVSANAEHSLGSLHGAHTARGTRLTRGVNAGTLIIAVWDSVGAASALALEASKSVVGPCSLCGKDTKPCALESIVPDWQR